MPTSPWPSIPVKVVDLMLDEQNVRLDLGSKAPSQDALIEDLFINQGANELAKSIARDGLFPNDLPIVAKIAKKYVVLEGNRRVAALKALLNPDVLPKYRTQLETLVNNSDQLPITEITVVEAPSREEAERIIARIHTTRGRKPWATLRQAYFYYAQVDSGKKTIDELIAEYEDVSIPRFVQMWEMHRIATSLDYSDAGIARQVAQQSKFPISTLERIYRDEQFQNAFGLQFKPNGSVEINADRTAFENAYGRVVEDIIKKKVTSRNFNTEEEIKEKVTKWAEPIAKAGKKTSVQTADDFKPKAPSKPTKKEKGLAPKDIVCSLPFPAIRLMLKELQDIDYENFPNATHDLLRSFLEQSLKAYYKHKGETIQGKGKYTFLEDALKHAETYFENVDKSLVQVVKVLRASAGSVTDNYLFTADYMNALNHNYNTFSTGGEVRTAWNKMEPLLRHLLDPK